MGRRTAVWTHDMIAELKRLRALNTPLFLCAELIGVCNQAAVLKARELGSPIGATGVVDIGRSGEPYLISSRRN